MGEWEKIDPTALQKIDKGVNLQAAIRTGLYACSAIDIKNTLVNPLVSGKKVSGEFWIYEEKSPELTIILGIKYVPAYDKWFTIACMSDPFTKDNAVETIEIVGNKILNFMNQHDLDIIWGSSLIYYHFEDSTYAEAGYTETEFINLIKQIFDDIGLEYYYNKAERRTETSRKSSSQSMSGRK